MGRQRPRRRVRAAQTPRARIRVAGVAPMRIMSPKTAVAATPKSWEFQARRPDAHRSARGDRFEPYPGRGGQDPSSPIAAMRNPEKSRIGSSCEKLAMELMSPLTREVTSAMGTTSASASTKSLGRNERLTIHAASRTVAMLRTVRKMAMAPTIATGDSSALNGTKSQPYRAVYSGMNVESGTLPTTAPSCH